MSRSENVVENLTCYKTRCEGDFVFVNDDNTLYECSEDSCNASLAKSPTQKLAHQSDGPVSQLAEVLLNDAEQRYEGYVYVIEAKEGLVKIGRSRDPESRVRSLNTGNPHDLELLKAVKFTDAKSIEKSLHLEFDDYCERGEWFDLGPERRDELLTRLEKLRGIDDDE